MNRLVALFPILAATVILTGCSEAIHNSGEDDAFIRTSNEAPPPVIKTSGPLLPVSTGTRWSDRVTLRRMNNSLNDSPPLASVDKISLGNRPLPGGESGVLIETRQSGQTTPIRSEYFQVSPKSVSLAGLGSLKLVTAMTPAFTLIQSPVKEGAVQKWQGILHVGKQNIAAQGYSRVAYQETLDLPSGKIGAYRVDVILNVMDHGQTMNVPMSYWFAPGTGIVKQRFVNSEGEVTLELAHYTPAPR